MLLTYKHHLSPECTGISHSKFWQVVHTHALLQLLILHKAPPDTYLCKTNPELLGWAAINILHVVWSVCACLWLVFAQAENNLWICEFFSSCLIDFSWQLQVFLHQLHWFAQWLSQLKALNIAWCLLLCIFTTTLPGCACLSTFCHHRTHQLATTFPLATYLCLLSRPTTSRHAYSI